MLTLKSLVVTMFAWHLESLPGTHFAQTNSPRLRTHHSVYIIYFWSPCISYTFDHPVLGQVNNNNNMLSNELEREKERENNNKFRGHCISLLQSTACTATLGPIESHVSVVSSIQSHSYHFHTLNLCQTAPSGYMVLLIGDLALKVFTAPAVSTWGLMRNI